MYRRATCNQCRLKGNLKTSHFCKKQFSISAFIYYDYYFSTRQGEIHFKIQSIQNIIKLPNNPPFFPLQKEFYFSRDKF